MIELISKIPESIGWTLVGFAACLCCVMVVKLAQTFIQMWKDYHEPEEDEND